MTEKSTSDVCVVTGTRAEYGLLKPLLFKLKQDPLFNLKLVVTGSHLSSLFGNTQTEIVEDGFYDYEKIPLPIEDDSKQSMAKATGVAIEKFTDLFSSYVPDLIVVLGDRFEIFAVVSVAHMLRIPVAHISGGDVTEGAVDDAFRHCMTKMSYLHFPGCEQSRKRIVQMGENPIRVFNVGEPGVENCLNLELYSREYLENDLKFKLVPQKYAVVTFHPVTMEDATEEQQLLELISAMDSFHDMSYIVTLANADAGGRTINDIWLKESKKRANWLVVSSLGVKRYLSSLKYCALVLGNSSSGIVEAPSIGVPTVDIGDRQKGRMAAKSVIHCEPIKEEIVSSIKQVLAPSFQEMSKHVESPYGDGKTSEKILKELKKFFENKNETLEKSFYDISFDIK